MDRKEREPNLIQLASWIWRVFLVIPGDQQDKHRILTENIVISAAALISGLHMTSSQT